jgi:ABC-2 type transport system permease protein
MLGKIVGIASVGLLQYALWFLMGFALYMANPMNIASKAGSSMVKPGELLMLVAFYLFGFVFFASIYAAMGAIVTTDQEAQQVNMPIVMCMVLPVMLLGLILQNPDATWVVVLCFIPFFAPTLMVMRASLVSVPLWQIFASLASLAVGTMVMAYLGAKVFRIGILMTGKRPTVPEILRWIREK